MPPGSRGAAAGWFPDPSQRAALRYWTGSAWSPWLSDGGPVWRDGPRPVTTEDLEHLRFVEEVFLPRAADAGLLDGSGRDRLTGFARRLAASTRTGPGAGRASSGAAAPGWATPHEAAWGQAVGARSGGSTAAAGPAHGAPGPGVARPVGRPGEAVHGPRTAPGRGPAAASRGVWAASVPAARSAARGWWARGRSSLGVDLAVHGLAYLGVVLLFVGVFGLVAFAFADVAPGLRPVAELVAAAVPFGAARLLQSRGAVVVARALGVVGGLLVPLMVVTSLVDGAPFPPDPTAPLRAVWLAGACAAIALGFGWWTRRRPGTAVRYAAAPALWLSAAMAVLAVGRPVPEGAQVAVPSAVQVMAMSLVLAACVALARGRSGSALGAATLRSATAGLPVLVVLAVVTWTAEGFPPVAVLATGVLVVAAAHALPSVPARLLDVGPPVWWAGVTLGVTADLVPGAVAAVAGTGFVALAELALRRRRDAGALAWPLAGLAVWLGVGLVAALAWTDAGSWWVVALFAAVTAWAATRRRWPSGGEAWVPLDTLAAGAPAGLAVSVGAARGDLGPGLAVAVLLVGMGAVAASVPALGRGSHDAFWRVWWVSAVAVTAVAAVVAGSEAGIGGSRRLDGALALVLLAVVVASGPVRPALRPPSVAVLGVAGWLVLCDVARTSTWVTAGALAGAGTAVVASGLRRRVPSASRSAHVLTGHGVGLGALVVAGLGGPGWPSAVACALATSAWAATAAVDEAGGPPLAPSSGRAVRYLPWVMTAVGVPATAFLTLRAAGVLGAADPWSGAVLSGTALAYAAASRTTTRRRPRTTAVWGAVVAAGGGLVVVVSGGWPLVVALAALCAAALLVPRPRPAVLTWAAWSAVAPLTGLLAWLTWPPMAARSPVTVASASLTAVGAALLVGAAAADLRGRRWAPRAVPVHPQLRAPALVGALQTAVGLVLGYGAAAPPRVLQLLTLVAGAALLAVAVLARAGGPAAVGAVLAWLGILGLGGEGLWTHPWPTLVVTAGLLAAAEAASRVGRERRWWARWDTAWLVASGPVAATTVLADARHAAVALVVVGLMCVAVAVRLRGSRVVAEVLGWTGTGLILLGAFDAGPGWPAVALGALSAAQAGLAARARGAMRAARQVLAVAAAVAAWFAVLAWLDLAPQAALDLTATAGGLVAVIAAGLARRTAADRSWAVVSGTAGALLVVGAGLGAGTGAAVTASWPTTVAWFAVSGALGAAAGPLRRAALREAAAVAVVAGVMTALDASPAGGATRVAVLAVVSAVLGVVTLALRRRAAWQRPALGAGAVLSVLAAAHAAGEPRAVLAAAVAAVAAQSAVAGVAQRVLALQVASPVVGCAAVLLLVSAAEQTHAYAYTVPIGLCLLVIVGLWRRDQRAAGRPPASGPLVGLEMAGVGMLVGTSFVLAFTESVLHALLAAGLAVLVAAWGMGTRVRRRVAAGVVLFLAALVVLVVVPLVDLLPAWGGAAFWVVLVVAGCLVVVAATMLERTRTAIQTSRARFGHLVSGWE